MFLEVSGWGVELAKFFSNFLRELFLNDALRDNLEYIFLTGINDAAADAGNDLAALPSVWNPTLWNYVAALHEQIFLPIASMILVLCIGMEIYHMVTERNNMHEIDVQDIMMLLLKIMVAFLVVKNIFPILLGIFDISAYAINQAAMMVAGTGQAPVDVNAYLEGIEDMSFGECMMLLFLSMLIRITIMIFNLAINVLVIGRMLQIYLYCSAAAIPAAAVTSKELDMSKNYFKNVCALGLQGFLMMFCLGAYSALLKNMTLSSDLNIAMLQVLLYGILLIFMLLKTSSIAKSIMNCH